MPFDPSMMFMIVILVLMIGMMWWQSKKAKKQQAKVNDFRESLKPGTEVATYSGLLGKIVEVDLEKEQAVVDSEGSLSRWRLAALTEPPIVPAYVHDDEVDEEGNRLEDKPSEAESEADASGAGESATDDLPQKPVESDEGSTQAK